jgi:LacI family transcriptional regulator
MSVASLKQVAQRAGVSVTTVSRFLNGSLHLPDLTRASIEDAVLALNYVATPLRAA